MRRNWSNSKPFRKLRKWFKIDKPRAAKWNEWTEWETNTKSVHPVGFWLTENLPDYLEIIPRIFLDPFYKVRRYLRCRFLYKTHVLPTGLKPGEWHDLTERLLRGPMEGLVDFVEIEKASLQRCHKTGSVWTKRSRELGMQYLEWETTLDNPSLPKSERSERQAEAAREIIRIYKWWKDIRPNRPDAMDISGWTEYCATMTMAQMFSDEEEKIDTSAMHEQIADIEEKYTAEDEEYLIRLIKIRNSLWT